MVDPRGFCPAESWVRVPDVKQAGLAQVALWQTQAFHLWTWSERRAFNPEVRGSSPWVGISHISSHFIVVERLTFNQVVMGSSPICDTNFGRPSGERRSFPIGVKRTGLICRGV